MADDENVEVEETVVVDYDALDEATGFKKVELAVWLAYEQMLAKPEDERSDPDAWAEEYAEEKKLDKRRVKAVVTLGIYAGPRDEFNQRSGSGKAIYSNGDVYDGDFFEGKKHGTGSYTFKKLGKSEVDRLIEKQLAARPSGESDAAFVERVAKALKLGTAIVQHCLELGPYACYHGEYQRGLRTGQGIMKNKDATVYKGDLRDNKRCGQGIFYYLNGDVYSGQWLDGLKHGFGTYRFANGNGEYRGEWLKGNFTHGQWILADGTFFEGKFDPKTNRPCDEAGAMHFPRTATTMIGVFKKGRWAPLAELAVSDEKPVDGEAWDA